MYCFGFVRMRYLSRTKFSSSTNSSAEKCSDVLRRDGKRARKEIRHVKKARWRGIARDEKEMP